MNWLRNLRRRLFPPTDGTICATPNPAPCDRHRELNGPCRCLDLPQHRGWHECGQGSSWDNYARSEA